MIAAYELLEDPERFQVTILEEDTRIGGVSKTIRHAGCRMDIVGHRFFSKDKRVEAWWKKILPVQGSLPYDDLKLGRSSPTEGGGPAPEIDDRVMLVRRRVSRIYYNGNFFDCLISNGQHRYNNMDHSMVAAFEAVKNIRQHISYKTNIWNVNTENGYHEERTN